MRLSEEIGGTGGAVVPKCRVIVADSQTLVGAGLAALVARLGYDVTAIVHDAAGVRAAIAAASCDILVIDVALFEPAFVQGFPVIVTAPVSNHPGLAAAIAQGVAGLILKTESAELLPFCLARVAAGGQWIDSHTLAQAAVATEAHKNAELLTRRERDVARLVAAGHRNRVIAASLGISEGTVKMHLHNVYTKLGLESRTQLAMDERARGPSLRSLGASPGRHRRQPCKELVA